MKRFERLAFSFSLMIISVLYGSVATALGLFPSSVVTTAFRQADAILSRPFLARRVYERAGAQTFEASSLQPGLTLVSTMWREDGDWTAGLRLIDHSGEVLHQWRIAPTEIFSELRSPSVRLWSREMRLQDTSIHGSYLFGNGDVLVNLEAVGSARLDACSEVLWALRERNHHSIDDDDDGNFWIPVLNYWDDAAAMAEFGDYPGLRVPIINNRVMKVSGDGAVLEDIPMLDVLYANGLQRYLAKSELSSNDVLHVNDVEPLSDSIAEEYPLFEAGDLLISLRNASLVLVLDPETRLVKWHASDPFIHQHDPDFIGDGWIGVYDNNQDGTQRGTMSGGSRILALQPHTDSMKVLFPTPDSEPFYTAQMGKWQLLQNGNMLLTESQPGRIVEVGPDGRTLWEWIHESASESRVPEVAEGTRYSLTPEQVGQWSCAPYENGGEAS